MTLGSETYSRADTTTIDDVLKSDIFDNVSATSVTVNDKTSEDSISNSSEKLSNSSDDNQHNIEVFPKVASQMDNDDSSKQLLSEESPDDVVDDQPVTTDLTLTKTVELTEFEPDPEPPLLPEPELEIAKPKSEQKTLNVNMPETIEPIEMENPIEEQNDLKEISQNNFESTMDDISDAELESLEQELEDLVASTEEPAEKREVFVITLEESIRNPLPEPDEESTAVIERIEEPANPVKPFEKTAEVNVGEILEDTSGIQEVAATSVLVNQSEQNESSVSEGQEAVEPSNLEQPVTPIDPDPVVSTSSTDESTSIQNLPSQSNEDFSLNEQSNSTGSLTSAPDLGRVPPYWYVRKTFDERL